MMLGPVLIRIGYTGEKVRRLTLDSLQQGFNHFKLKVGADPEDDLRRGLLIRSIIDEPKNLPADRKIDPKTIEGKNAGPAGCVLMVDSNRKSDPVLSPKSILIPH